MRDFGGRYLIAAAGHRSDGLDRLDRVDASGQGSGHVASYRLFPRARPTRGEGAGAVSGSPAALA